MENRPAPLRSRRVCRFCLTETEPLNFIYERDHGKPFQVPLTLQIMSCVSIEVYAADGMPQMICGACRWNLDRSYKFKLRCKKADEALRAYPVTGVLPRPFPPITNDSPEASSGKRPSEQRLQAGESAKKQRVDNGERDRQRAERQQDKRKQRGDRDDSYAVEREPTAAAVNDKDERKLEPGEIRVHACDRCDRTFPLRQALQLHAQRAHRDRNYKCTECDRTFFSKYDLGKHATTHSSEKPYSCSVCNKSFTRANLLQRHEKLHRDEARFACQHCDREFFTSEELEKHEDASHKTTKPYRCNICDKRFAYKQGLERHELLHSEDKSFVCEYCKEAFRTSTKLARHLATHSGHRPYLCKLCPRSFLLSHHLTRHMRSHSVEKRHVCEDCGKAFKRKESLEVHQLTHAKRSGMALTCDVCQESCRNRADYVTHIKQHIEAGEKMGPDGLQPDKAKMETDSEDDDDDEDEERDENDDDDDDDEDGAYSDGGDDDYEPPAYVVKKLPKVKLQPPESEEEDDPSARMEQQQQQMQQQQQQHHHESEDRKEQVVFVRGKDGNIVKKTIKTLMPIQRRGPEVTETQPPTKSVKTLTPTMTAATSTPKKGDDSTEAEVQKIVASVFKEHKIPLKHASTSGESPGKETTKTESSALTRVGQASRKEPDNSALVATTAKGLNTVKVIKRIVVRKPIGGTSGDQTVAGKEGELGGIVGTATTANTTTATPTSQSPSATKVTKRVIVRRIIRHGDTTREVIMNPDGTIIDPAELAKLPTGNVVKRVVVKKALDNKNSSFVQQVLKPLTDARLAGTTTTTTTTNTTMTTTTGETTLTTATTKNQPDNLLEDVPKFELKTLQALGSASSAEEPIGKIEAKANISDKGDRETKEKLELLEKRVEQQRIKIEELQARKQQETEAIDESLPDRHDESEDEQQQLPLKRVFVKRKQSIYDEEQEYEDDDEIGGGGGGDENVEDYDEDETDTKKQQQDCQKERKRSNLGDLGQAPLTRGKQLAITSSKVYTNKKVIFVKTEDPSEIDEMSREIGSILNSSDSVVKMQENVLTNLSEISGIDETPIKTAVIESMPEPMEEDDSNNEDELETSKIEEAASVAEMMMLMTTSAAAVTAETTPTIDAITTTTMTTTTMTIEPETTTPSITKQVTVDNEDGSTGMIEIAVTVAESSNQEDETSLSLVQEDISGSADIFETTDSPIICPKTEVNLEESVIELAAHNETISLNETNESQDSLEDKLSRMEG